MLEAPPATDILLRRVICSDGPRAAIARSPAIPLRFVWF